MALLRYLRVGNLVIVVITLYFIRYSLIYPFLYKWKMGFAMSHLDFGLLSLVTVLLTLGGYLINDYYDYEIDCINKPDKVYIGKKISKKKLLFLYLFLQSLALILSVYLSAKMSYWQWFFLFPSAVFLLWFYSYRLKKTVLWGNLIVALFCAFVPLLVFLADKSQIQQLSKHTDRFIPIAGFYIWFAFFSTLLREVVKDYEDKEGDEKYGCMTFAIRYSERASKILMSILALILAMGSLFFALKWIEYFQLRLFMLFAILLPIASVVVKIYRAETKNDWHQISSIIKWIMLAGLIMLPLFSYINTL